MKRMNMQHCNEIHGPTHTIIDVITVAMVMMVPDKSDQKFKVQHACGLGMRYMEQESV